MSATTTQTFSATAENAGAEVNGSVSSLDRVPRLVLEICRGRTRFPQRPVVGPRFFIGSGPSCDLRLGGDLPTLHSLIQIRENGVWFEALAELPVVFINGIETRGEWLRDGDCLEFGPFQFLAHLRPLSPAAQALPEYTEEISELSASQLIDRLEAELAAVDEYDRRQQAGGEALLEAVRRQQRAERRGQVRTHGGHTQPPAPHFHRSAASKEQYDDDLDRLLEDLHQLSGVIEQHSESLTQRELTFSATAEMLLASQRELLQQLEAALERALQLSDEAVSRPLQHRASA